MDILGMTTETLLLQIAYGFLSQIIVPITSVSVSLATAAAASKMTAGNISDQWPLK